MLFNSYEFILVFLPVTVVLFLVLGRSSRSMALGWLILASLAFYAWWRPLNVLIIAPSIAINYALARGCCSGSPATRRARAAVWLLALGIVFNVCFLGYFKYANFAVAVDERPERRRTSSFHQVILPLGISFITFQKIAFLIDVARWPRSKAFTLRDYLLFVLFFPQLIAGPIVHYRETMPQFERATCRFDKTRLRGRHHALLLRPVQEGGAGRRHGRARDPGLRLRRRRRARRRSLLPAWMAAVGFTLQIYFDFSGYSDMALRRGALLRRAAAAQLRLAAEGRRASSTSGCAGTSR